MKWNKTKYYKFGIILFLGAANLNAIAQGKSGIVESMHSSGKIYVVVAVITLIFLVITAFLFSLERKISKLEKQIKNKP